MGFFPAAATTSAGVQPYQFRPETYGAVGNGVVCSDVNTNGTTTIVSPTVAAKAVAGQTIMINGANSATGAPLITTINSVTGTGAILAAPAGITATACAAVFGNDDRSAINQAVQAASAYALANNYYGQVLFGAKTYMLTSGPTQTSSPAVQNSQIQIPFPAQNGQSQKLVIALTGAGDSGQLQYWESITPNLQGTVLVSTLNNAPSTLDPTFGGQSVVGGPSGSAGFTGGYANVKPVVQGITIFVPVLQNMIGWDFQFCAGVYMDRCSAQGFAPAANLAGATAAHPYLSDLPSLVAFQSTISRGFKGPAVQNNDDFLITSLAVEGFEVGAWLQDHATVLRLATLYVDVGVRYDVTTTNQSNLLSIANWSCEIYNGGLQSLSGGGGFMPVDICMTAEEPGGANPTYDVSDAGNSFYGTFWIFANGRTSKVPVVSGATNLRVINGDIGPGHLASPPAVPATTVSAVIQYRDASVVVHTGAGVTVSAITVDGVATSQTVAAASSSVPISVPTGKTIALTYAGGTPTWDWWLN